MIKIVDPRADKVAIKLNPACNSMAVIKPAPNVTPLRKRNFTVPAAYPHKAEKRKCPGIDKTALKEATLNTSPYCRAEKT